jgi:predicted RNA-binding Zn ribbon-like protein
MAVTEVTVMDEGRLRLVRDFVNTYERDTASDALASPAALADWFRRNDLPGAGQPVSGTDLAHAIELREAIRALLEVNHRSEGGPAAERAAHHLTAAARRSRLHVQFTVSGTARLVAAADRPLGELLVRIAEAMSDGRWRRLKVCHNDACRWAFFDCSRAGAGKWCSMAVCGNRHKAQTWRTRHREALQ